MHQTPNSVLLPQATSPESLCYFLTAQSCRRSRGRSMTSLIRTVARRFSAMGGFSFGSGPAPMHLGLPPGPYLCVWSQARLLRRQQEKEDGCVSKIRPLRTQTGPYPQLSPLPYGPAPHSDPLLHPPVPSTPPPRRGG